VGRLINLDKVCRVCGKTKQLEMFAKRSKDKYRNECKECTNLKKRKTPVPPKPKDGFKFCASCKEEKSLDKFSVRFILGKNRPYSYCKECERKRDNNRYAHTCNVCHKEYRSGRKDSHHCKECHDEHFIKTYSLLGTLDLSGEKNPMYGKQRFGKENPNYKPNKTDDEREHGRLFEGYGVWRKAVYERDDYTCQCCGKKSEGDIVAHHKDAYSWCKDRRTDVDNGVTLCQRCHHAFHNKYGRGKNTERQFLEFISYYKVENTLP